MENKEPVAVKRKTKRPEGVEDNSAKEKTETVPNRDESPKTSSKEYTQAVSKWLMQYRTYQWMQYCSQHAVMMAPYFFGSPIPPVPQGTTPPEFPTASYGLPPPAGGAVGHTSLPHQQNAQGQQPHGQFPAAGQVPFSFPQPPAVNNRPTPVQQQQPAQPQIPQLTASEFTLPSLYRRVFAEIIDFILLFVMKFGVTLFIIEYMGIVDPSSFMMRFLIEEIDEDSTFEDLQQMLLFAFIYRVVVCTYETFFLRHGLGTRVGGATPGKYCMGLRVVSCDRVQTLGGNRVLVTSPEDLTYLQAFLRAIIKNFSMAFFFPACITVFFNPHFRAAYDILTRSVVVSVPNWAERLRPHNR
ncbi:protein FAM8A1-like [Acanthaster planci]|uniref:Protein FAM8A1-like n=1 Tax=Acanthaster planci TaxID=133434 RepID=A0A8B7Z990_ACAPL|nr:protein FAM8A1-like [Acanthaster planci]